MATHFQKEIQLRFREADPAGIVFFANIFDLAHDCFEDFIQAAGFTWPEWFQSKEYTVPIRHTECDFLKPFFPGQSYQVTASVARLGDSSFQIKYLFSQDSDVHATVRMTHVFMNPQTHTKTSIPELVRNRLKVYFNGEEKES